MAQPVGTAFRWERRVRVGDCELGVAMVVGWADDVAGDVEHVTEGPQPDVDKYVAICRPRGASVLARWLEGAPRETNAEATADVDEFLRWLEGPG